VRVCVYVCAGVCTCKRACVRACVRLSVRARSRLLHKSKYVHNWTLYVHPFWCLYKQI